MSCLITRCLVGAEVNLLLCIVVCVREEGAANLATMTPIASQLLIAGEPFAFSTISSGNCLVWYLPPANLNFNPDRANEQVSYCTFFHIDGYTQVVAQNPGSTLYTCTLLSTVPVSQVYCGHYYVIDEAPTIPVTANFKVDVCGEQLS
jgi:hypothetical protein